MVALVLLVTLVGFLVVAVEEEVVVVVVGVEDELSGDFVGVDVLDDEIFGLLAGDDVEEVPAGGAADGFFLSGDAVEDWEDAAEEGFTLEETAAGETEAG